MLKLAEEADAGHVASSAIERGALVVETRSSRPIRWRSRLEPVVGPEHLAEAP